MPSCLNDSMVTVIRLIQASRAAIVNEQQRVFCTSPFFEGRRRAATSWLTHPEVSNAQTDEQIQPKRKRLNELFDQLRTRYLDLSTAVKQNSTLNSATAVCHQTQERLWSVFWHYYDKYDDKHSFLMFYIVYSFLCSYIILAGADYLTRADTSKVTDECISGDKTDFLTWDYRKEGLVELQTKQKELHELLSTKDNVDVRIEELQKEIKLLKFQKHHYW